MRLTYISMTIICIIFRVMLKGPPGTGKTLLAKAISNELNCNFFQITQDFLHKQYVGADIESWNYISYLAKSIATLTNRQTLIYFDECDSYFNGMQNEATAYLAGLQKAFQSESDGFASNDPSNMIDGVYKVIYLGSTNHYERIEPAIQRRFTLTLEVPIPNDS